MKKLILGISMLLSIACNAQEQAGGSSNSALGELGPGAIIAGQVVLFAIASNSMGTSISDTDTDTDTDATCNDGDQLVDGVCINTTTGTVTTSVAGTVTNTIVTLTSTYLPG